MLKLYTDGSSTGKVGEGGWAFVLLAHDKPIHESYGGADETTNNRMELSGVIEGLSYVYDRYPPSIELIIYCDSQYVVKGINEWYPKWEQAMSRGKQIKNQDLWVELKSLIDLFTNTKLKWIRGHSGVEHNERCDVLAKQGKLEIKQARDESRQLRKG